MKRFFLFTTLLLCTLSARAQKQDLLDFVFNPPWLLTPSEVVLNYPGVDYYPLLEALYPPAELLAAFPEENCTLSGFEFAGHDAYIVFPSSDPNDTIRRFVAIISPETTMGDSNKGLLLVINQSLGRALGMPLKENSWVDNLDEGITVNIDDVWQSDSALFAPFYMTMEIFGSAPALYGFMVERNPEDPDLLPEAAYDEPTEAYDEPTEAVKTLEEALEDGTAPHLLFRDIPIEGPLEVFCRKLEKLGYVRDNAFTPTVDYEAHLTGSYGNMPCHIYLCASPITKTVYGVDVFLGHSTYWNELKNTASRFEGLLETKYNSEGERQEQYGSPYFEGCNNELRGLASGFVVYQNEISCVDTELGVGFVTVSISPDKQNNAGWVCISFLDYGFLGAQKELQQLI